MPEHPVCALLGIEFPLIQAPMAGAAGPVLVDAVAETGILASLAVGALDDAAAENAIAKLGDLAERPIAINVFTHPPPHRDSANEQAWIEHLSGSFAAAGILSPESLSAPYGTFDARPRLLELLLDHGLHTISFHFGLPAQATLERLRSLGVRTLTTVSSLHEARISAAAGIDVLVAQGREAGGHHGTFENLRENPHSTLELVRTLAHRVDIPVMAAGGLMTGSDIADATLAGAAGAQLGTAFLCCPESDASPEHRRRLMNPSAETGVMRVISGRAARGLVGAWTRMESELPDDLSVPDYPVAYDAGKALAAGGGDWAVQWAGTGAGSGRALPAAELVATLRREYDAAISSRSRSQ